MTPYIGPAVPLQLALPARAGLQNTRKPEQRWGFLLQALMFPSDYKTLASCQSSTSHVYRLTSLGGESGCVLPTLAACGNAPRGWALITDRMLVACPSWWLCAALLASLRRGHLPPQSCSRDVVIHQVNQWAQAGEEAAGLGGLSRTISDVTTKCGTFKKVS